MGGWTRKVCAISSRCAHLPVVMRRGSVIVLVLALLIVMVPMGVTLSMFWRRSGNLLVPGAAHAVNDAVRNVLVGLP